MNLFAPAPYAERIVQLALGVEPRDAVLGTRAGGPTVTLDQHPTPLHLWRSWPKGAILDEALPKMARHDSGRYLSLLEDRTTGTVRIRLVDRSRRYVPRRFAIQLPDADEMSAPARIIRPVLHPGATYPITGTVVRGRVLDAQQVPVRWVRAEATLADSGDSIGWAHGDDRGEFVLAIGNAAGQVGLAANPLRVAISVSFATVAPEPPADDPLTTTVDPIWDLPEEQLSLPDDEAAAGRKFLDDHTTHTFPTLQLTLGRTRSLELTLP
jgi:hypothetical protein